MVSVFVNEGLSIGSNTKYPEVCKDFIHFFFTDKELYGEFLKSEQLFATTKETVEYEMIPLRKQMEEMIADMVQVEGFESMTGDDAFLPGLKDYFTNKLTQNIAIGADVEAELDAIDAEWEIANEAIEDAPTAVPAASLVAPESDSRSYTLTGVQASDSTRGIVIENNQKRVRK